ncbi:MAG: ribulose-phosphate 3-epimerase [Anaerolineae bacterium]|nr:ribulose-phosphate 3-epimerase [Anaerolineae bacterium]MCX8066461.1 ribulose-phosphate 3-epimerase [Anaerolineae bacterium]
MNRISAIKIAPSILAADFARLADAVAEAEAAGADAIHVDVMDGQFVPNITVGIPVVAALRRITRLPLDVHLMIVQPERHIRAFAEAGANYLTVQVEACVHLHRVLQTIRSLGLRAGVALNPATPPVMISQVLNDIDLVLVMTVNPGFSGQTFIPGMVAKIAEVRRMLDEAESLAELEVDGGINPQTAPLVVRAGARMLVAGKAIYGAREGVAAALRALRQAAERELEAVLFGKESQVPVIS